MQQLLAALHPSVVPRQAQPIYTRLQLSNGHATYSTNTLFSHLFGPPTTTSSSMQPTRRRRTDNVYLTHPSAFSLYATWHLARDRTWTQTGAQAGALSQCISMLGKHRWHRCLRQRCASCCGSASSSACCCCCCLACYAFALISSRERLVKHFNKASAASYSQIYAIYAHAVYTCPRSPILIYFSPLTPTLYTCKSH